MEERGVRVKSERVRESERMCERVRVRVRECERELKPFWLKRD